MPEPKVLVLSVRPNYAFCYVDGKPHVERFSSPLSKEDIQKRVITKFAKVAEPASVPLGPVESDLPEFGIETVMEPE